MPDFSKLQELLARQKILADEMAVQTSEFTGDKLLGELQSLKAENEILRKNCSELERERKSLDSENRAISESLKNQLRSERSRFLHASDERMSAYFGSDTASGRNALTALEKDVERRFSELRGALDQESSEVRRSYERRMTELEAQVSHEISALRKSYRDLSHDADTMHREHTSLLGKKDIDGRTTDRVVSESDNKVERLVGISILGKIGAVIIIIGMIALSQLAYTMFDEVLKCVFMFGVATVILAFALWLNRKKEKRNPFTITILSLGVALEYTALTISYFTLSVLSIWAALGICVGIFVVSYTIALWQKSEVVASFAQIGGYLPIIAIFQDVNLIYGAMVYFLILNVFGFLLSMKYKWQILNYISFGLNISAVVAVAVSVAIIFVDEPFGLVMGLTLGFIFLSFMLHTLLPLLTNIRKKTQFSRADLILMGLTTSANLALMYTMFAQYGISDYSGYLSLFFAAFYLGIYFVARKFLTADATTKTLFWLTGIVFLGLFVPMHFADAAWFTFGWALEGAMLLIYALLRSKKFMFWTGVAISVLALLSFIIFDLILYENYIESSDVFIYKYLLLTIASIAVLAAAVYKGKLVLGCRMLGGRRVFIDRQVTLAQIYSAATYLNLAGFLVYSVWKLFFAVAGEQITSVGNIQYLMFSIMIITLFVLSVVVPKVYRAYLVHRVSFALSAATFIFLIVVNSLRLPTFGTEAITGETVGAAFLTILTTLASGYAFYDLYIGIADLFDRKNLRAGLLVALTSYLLFWFTHLSLVQFRLEFVNLSFGIVYMVAAIICLALGLYLRSTMTRRFALAIAGAAIFKLFIIDTFGLELEFRIICYFVFGAILIGMSFLYQHFYKKYAKAKSPEEIEDQTGK